MNDTEMTDTEVNNIRSAATPMAPTTAGDTGEQQGARDLLLATASQIMREGDQVDISLSELSLRSG